MSRPSPPASLLPPSAACPPGFQYNDGLCMGWKDVTDASGLPEQQGVTVEPSCSGGLVWSSEQRACVSPPAAEETKKSFPWKPVLIGAGILGAIGLLFAVAGSSSSSDGEGTEEA